MTPPKLRGEITRDNTKQNAQRLLTMLVEKMLVSNNDSKVVVALKSSSGVITAKVTTQTRANDGMQVEQRIEKIITDLGLSDCYDEVTIDLTCQSDQLTANFTRVTPYRWHMDG